MTATSTIATAMRSATAAGVRRYDGPIVADPAVLDDPRVDSTTWESWARTCLDADLVTLRGLRFAARQYAARHHHAAAIVPWTVEITHDRVRRQQVAYGSTAATGATRKILDRLLAWSGDLLEIVEIVHAAHRNHAAAMNADRACRGKTTKTAQAAGLTSACRAYEAAESAYGLIETRDIAGRRTADSQREVESIAADYGYGYLDAARGHLIALCQLIDAAECRQVAP